MAKREEKPKVPTERPDKNVAKQPPRKNNPVDRPGFDLGGAKEIDENEPMRNPRSDPAEDPKAPGRSGGIADPGGSRSGRRGAGSESGGGSTEGS